MGNFLENFIPNFPPKNRQIFLDEIFIYIFLKYTFIYYLQASMCIF